MAPRSRVLLSHPTEADEDEFVSACVPAARCIARGCTRRRRERQGFSPRYLKIGRRWRDHERWAIRRETWLG